MPVRFSVLMPVYNREQFLRQAIESILSQTFTSFELIAIDDGSTDGSAEILRSFGDRIKFIQQTNHGPEVARNAGAAIAQGEYLALMDSDDFLFPYAFETYDRIIRALNAPPVILGADVFYKEGVYYRDDKVFPAETFVPGPIKIVKYRDYISKTVPLTTPNSKIVIKKSVFDEIGGLRNSTPLTFHNDDLDLLLKTGTYSPCIVVDSPVTVAYRMHEGNSIKGVKLIAEGMVLLAEEERRGEYPGGPKRRWERYAVIGGRASTWALRYCWRGGQRKLAFRLLYKTAPMVMAALWNKSMRPFRKPVAAVPLPE